jgi:hypothetical protein
LIFEIYFIRIMLVAIPPGNASLASCSSCIHLNAT